MDPLLFWQKLSKNIPPLEAPPTDCQFLYQGGAPTSVISYFVPFKNMRVHSVFEYKINSTILRHN